MERSGRTEPRERGPGAKVKAPMQHHRRALASGGAADTSMQFSLKSPYNDPVQRLLYLALLNWTMGRLQSVLRRRSGCGAVCSEWP